MPPITVTFLFERASSILSLSILMLIGVATVVFMWGVIQYVLAKGDEKQLSAGKSYMMYGIIGLTVMVAVWGFVNLLIFTIFGTTSGVDQFSFTIPSV